MRSITRLQFGFVLRISILLLVAGAGLDAKPTLLFVFPAESPQGEVYDSKTLALIARPEIALGSRVAFGLSGANPSASFAKFYVVGSDSVAVLNEDFSLRTTLFLPETLAGGVDAAALSPDSKRLLIAAGQNVYVFSAETDKLLVAVSPGFALGRLAVSADSQRAYVASAAGDLLRMLDLESLEFSPGAFRPPEPLLSFAASPDGSRTFASSENAFYDLSRITLSMMTAALPASQFAALPPEQRTLVLSAQGGFVLRRAGGVASGSLAAGSEIRGLFEFDNPSAASAVTPDGSRIFVSEPGQPRLSVLDSSSTSSAEIELLQPAAYLSVVAPQAVAAKLQPPRVEQDDSLIVKISGDGPQDADSTFELIVSGPSGGVPLTITPSSAVVTCDPAILSLETTITCMAGSVEQVTPVTITVAAVGLGQVVFSISIVPPLADGLTKVSGDGESAGSNSSIDFEVLYRTGGQPAADAELTLSDSEGDAELDCPSTVTTDSQGVAAFSCDTGTIETTHEAAIVVTVGTFSVTFDIVLLGDSGGPDELIKISADSIAVTEQTQFNLVVESRVDGLPEEGVQLSVVPDDALVTCPSTVVTGSNGRATILCSADRTTTSRLVQVVVTDGVLSVNFTVNVIPEAPTGGEGLVKIGGDNQIVPRNTIFPLDLAVKATLDGAPQPSISLNVLPNSNAVFCPSIVVTNVLGEVRFKCSTANVSSQTEVEIEVTDGTRTLVGGPFHLTITTTDVGTADGLLLLSPATITAKRSSTVVDAIRVRTVDEDVLPVSGAVVFFSSPNSEVTMNPAIASSNASGIATTSVTLGCPNRAGTIDAGLTAGGSEVMVRFEPLPGDTTIMQKIRGDNQSGAPGELLTANALVVQLTDECRQPSTGEVVAWSVQPPGAATLQNVVNTTDGQGRSSALVKLGNIAGPFTVTATSGSLEAVFDLTVINVAAQLIAESGGGQIVPALGPAPQPLVARVLTDTGTGVAGIDVAFSVVSGGGTISAGSVATGADGRASVSYTAGSSLGQVLVRASAAEKNVTFNLTVVGRAPNVPLAGFVNGASFRPGWTPGAAGSIFGQGITEGIDGVVLAPADIGAALKDGTKEQSSGVFPTEFRGVSVLVNGVPAPIFALANVTGQEQINIQVPTEALGASTATVVITNNGSSTTVQGVPLAAVRPEIFQNGGFAAALHVDFSAVTASNPARPGEIIQLFLTSLGLTNPPVGTNQVGPVPLAEAVNRPTVGLDNAGVPSTPGFAAPGLVSVYQINFTVPQNAQPGNRELNVVAAGVSSQRVLLPVGQ